MRQEPNSEPRAADGVTSYSASAARVFKGGECEE